MPVVRHINRITHLRVYRGTPAGYAIALAAFGCAVGIRYLLDPWVSIPYATLFAAAIVAALAGGWAASILGILLAGAMATFLWPTAADGAIDWHNNVLNYVLYVLIALGIAYLVHILNMAAEALQFERDRSSRLFRELQHRTANNLHSVSSLLNLSISRVRREPGAVFEVLGAVKARLETMGRIHRHLYQERGTTYRLERELNDVVADVLFALGASNVDFVVEARDVELDQDQILPLSLFIVELVINSVKHAFTPGEPGKISVAVTRSGIECALFYRDTGKGCSASDIGERAEGMGFAILRSLARELKGRIRVEDGGPGFQLVLNFPSTVEGKIR